MGKQGKSTPAGIEDFVVETWQNAPRLTYGQIADRVAEEYGEGAKIDKSTVGRILLRRGAKVSGEPREAKPSLKESLASPNVVGKGLESWISGNLRTASRAIAGYLDHLSMRIQREEIHRGHRATVMLPRTNYGLDSEAVIASIRDQDSKLQSLEQDFDDALNREANDQSRTLKNEIERRLRSWLRI